jgi:hypothetical protein
MMKIGLLFLIFLSIQCQSFCQSEVGEYYNRACALSLRKSTDSAFHYLHIIATFDELSTKQVSEIENDDDLISLKKDKRWQPLINSLYKKAFAGIKKLSEEVRNGARINPSFDKYDIALAWTIAGNADSAFSYLNSIINTDINRLVSLPSLTEQRIFDTLRNDQRWQPLIDEIKRHEVFFVCKHQSEPFSVPMSCTIDPKSVYLKDDGRGSFLNNENKVSSRQNFAYNLLVSGISGLIMSGNWKDSSARFLILDLNSPIKNSGAIKQGVIKDHFAEFHIFSKMDTSTAVHLIYNFNDIAIGSTVESPRTEISIHLNGKVHLLQLGYWSLGDCGEPYSYGAKINGRGTTTVKITRHSTTSYTIEATHGSIGRLWDISNLTHPVDKGLFRTGFLIHLNRQ